MDRRSRWAVILMTLTASCQIVGDFRPFSGPDASPADAAADAVADAAADAGPCPPLPPSKIDMVRGAELRSTVANGDCTWVDRTEVTMQQYSAWLLMDPLPTWDPERCAWKGDSGATNPLEAGGNCPVPADEPEPFDSSLPVRCVDWCDALTFCTYYGARLCWSSPSNLSLATSPMDPSVPEDDEWGGACSGSVDNLFPYGNEYDVDACRIGTAGNCLNTPDGIATCGPLPPDTFPQCVSPVGAVDMIGNVREWVHYCDINGDDTVCSARGGDWSDDGDAACLYGSGGIEGGEASSASLRRDTPDAYTGFRCCADLLPVEQQKLNGQ